MPQNNSSESRHIHAHKKERNMIGIAISFYIKQERVLIMYTFYRSLDSQYLALWSSLHFIDWLSKFDFFYLSLSMHIGFCSHSFSLAHELYYYYWHNSFIEWSLESLANNFYCHYVVQWRQNWRPKLTHTHTRTRKLREITPRHRPMHYVCIRESSSIIGAWKSKYLKAENAIRFFSSSFVVVLLYKCVFAMAVNVSHLRRTFSHRIKAITSNR